MKTRRKTGTGLTHRAASRPRPAARGPGKRVKTKAPAARPSSRVPASAAKNAAVAALAADCTIARAEGIKAQLDKLLKSSAAVTIDLSGVRRIDTAGFQVLAAFIRERHAAGRDVQCQGASESFGVTASLLGLGALFGPAMDDRLLAPAAGAA